MATRYRVTLGRRLSNAIISFLARRGRAGEHTYVLTVRGRKTGREHSTPVRLIEDGDARWLVAPYGEVAWVRNARSAGRVKLTRAGKTEELGISEAHAPEAAPVLKKYATEVRVTRPYFDAQPNEAASSFEAEAPRHPVFRLAPFGTTGP